MLDCKTRPRTVSVTLVIRDPVDALIEGAVRRAKEEESMYGSGRPVSLGYFLKAHPAALENIFRLENEYKGYPDVNFSFVDNTHGKKNVREVSLEQAKQFEFKDVAIRAKAALEKEYRDGRISEKIYKSFKP